MRVAIIGAGPSGLACIKSCIEENHQPVCFERSSSLGGQWKFSDAEGGSAVYQSTVINTSKELSCFSDFPVPKRFAVFMPHSEIIQYLHMYATSFNLHRNITFDTTVTQVWKAEDYIYSGKWQVKYQKHGKDPETKVFDAVLVCTGHHWCPFTPSFAGIYEFTGRQLHSHSYKKPIGFDGKTVLVVGLGNSAADIASELSHNAAQVYLSTRRGAWVISRLANQGIPWDFYSERRIYQMLPSKLIEWMFMKMAQERFDHDTFGIRPKHGMLDAPTVISDELPFRLANGTLKLKPDISFFTKTGVVFEDDSSVENLDVVIFCTGYKISFSFLDQDIVDTQDNQVSLYKYVFPPDLVHPTLAFIGLAQSSGSMFPLVELQARWVSQILSGKCVLPCRDEMINEIVVKKEAMQRQFIQTKRCTIQVPSIGYKDEIAEMIACKPCLWKLFFSNPSLALLCLFGPCTPAQYRLNGRGAWPGAKDTITNAYANMYPARKTCAMRVRGSVFGSLGHATVQVTGWLITEIANQCSAFLYSLMI